jgi:hypothetical protein
LSWRDKLRAVLGSNQYAKTPISRRANVYRRRADWRTVGLQNACRVTTADAAASGLSRRPSLGLW